MEKEKQMALTSSFKNQLQNNLLAIISLFIAISALSYNSWRNEQSEANRNLRAAGFEIMREAAHLQLLIDTATYSENVSSDDAIKGWVSINLIVSLSELMTAEIEQIAIELKSVWSENWSDLYQTGIANQQISKANSKLVKIVKLHLKGLN